MEEYKKSILEYPAIRDAVDYAREEGMEEGLVKGMEKGIEKGIEKEKIQIAQNCLKEGISIETISRLTGLSIEQIKSII